MYVCVVRACNACVICGPVPTTPLRGSGRLRAGMCLLLHSPNIRSVSVSFSVILVFCGVLLLRVVFDSIFSPTNSDSFLRDHDSVLAQTGVILPPSDSTPTPRRVDSIPIQAMLPKR